MNTEGSKGVVDAMDVVKSAYKAFDCRGTGRVSAKVQESTSGLSRISDSLTVSAGGLKRKLHSFLLIVLPSVSSSIFCCY